MNVRVLLLTTGGLGLMRPAPGTWSSLPIPILAAALASWGWGVMAMSVLLVGLIVAGSIVCIAFGEYAEKHFGKKDPGSVTADEVAGQALTMFALPWREQSEADWLTWNATLAVTAFLAFRFFDIIKIPPAAQLQRVKGGWGILFDDLIAGAYALGATHAVAWWVLPKLI